MLKAYLVTYKFYYNGKEEGYFNSVQLLKEPFTLKFSGEYFSGLWDLVKKYPAVIPAAPWEFKKGKKFIELYNHAFFTINEKNCKPWSFEVSCEETDISMRKLMEFNVEDVIEYLKERGITSYPIIK